MIPIRRGAVRSVSVAAMAIVVLLPLPQTVLALGDEVRQVSAGQVHSCAVRSDATAWCWGSDSSGQLGDGTTGDPTTHLRLSPVQVRKGSGFLTRVRSVSAGTSHTCAVRTDGTAWCWGFGRSGQLGDGTTGDAQRVRLKAVQVRKGSGFLTGVTAISAGPVHTCARRGDGTAWCWGDAAAGQIGDGTIGDAGNRRLKAVQVRRGSGFLTGVTSVTAGGMHSCARRSDGTAWCWGSDAQGQLGDGTTGNADSVRLKAVQVRRGSRHLIGVTMISAANDHTCARRHDGTAWCWGNASAGQLGDGTIGDANEVRLTAVKVRRGSGILTGVTSVTTGAYHSCARRSDGTAWCWGSDDFGQLGDGTTGDAQHVRLKAVQVRRASGPLTGVTAVSAGGTHTCAQRSDRTARCWGADTHGQLGDGGADPGVHPFAIRVDFP